MSRIYTEQEAADLFRRAAEMQAAQAHPDAPGLTLDELKRAGQAAGIEPAFLDRALTAPATTSHEPTHFLGQATSVNRLRFVPHRITDETWGRIVHNLRETLGAYGDLGHTETFGGIHQWKRAPLRFVAEPTEGGTELRAAADWNIGMKWAVGVTAVMVAMLLALCLTTVARGDTSALIAFVIITVAYAGGSLIGLNRYRGKAERIGTQFDAVLAHAVTRLAEADPVSAISTPVTETVPLPQIALDGDRTPDAAPDSSASRTLA